MATINRYSNIQPSAYNPLSLQEMMLSPSMMRKKHDELDDQINISGDLIQADPLDVHFEEASRLKNQYDQKLSTQADMLASEGFNTNTKNSIRQTNREIQKLISPTGRIGQINAAKQVYNQNLKNYLADSTKNKGWSREKALQNWELNRRSKYTGFDEENNITFIDQYGAPKKVETLEKLKSVKNLLGEQVIKEIANNNMSLQPLEDGSIMLVDGSGRRIETSNRPNLQNALNLLTTQMNDEEWGRSMQFEGVDPKNVLKEVTYGINSMLKTSVKDNRNNTYSLKGYVNNKKEIVRDLEAVNVEAVNVSKNQNLLDRLNGIEKDKDWLSGIGGSFGTRGNFNKKGIQMYDENEGESLIKKTIMTPEYKIIARGLSKTNESLKNKKDDSPEMIEAVKNYLKDNKDVAVQNRYVDANINKAQYLFASKEIPKDKKAASKLMYERALQGAYEVRTFDGELIDPEDLSKYNLTYSGDMTPKSQIGQIFTNPDQNIGARRGIIIDKDSNESQKVYISRGSDDFKTPQYKAMKTINSISKITDTQPDIFHNLTSPLFNAYGWKNVEIRYNKHQQSYDLSYTNDEGVPVNVQNIPDEKFQENILQDYENLYN